jgi:hypothetical protein
MIELATNGRRCADCGTDISHRARNTYRCSICADQRRYEQVRRFKALREQGVLHKNEERRRFLRGGRSVRTGRARTDGWEPHSWKRMERMIIGYYSDMNDSRPVYGGEMEWTTRKSVTASSTTTVI